MKVTALTNFKSAGIYFNKGDVLSIPQISAISPFFDDLKADGHILPEYCLETPPDELSPGDKISPSPAAIPVSEDNAQLMEEMPCDEMSESDLDAMAENDNSIVDNLPPPAEPKPSQSKKKKR